MLTEVEIAKVEDLNERAPKGQWDLIPFERNKWLLRDGDRATIAVVDFESSECNGQEVYAIQVLLGMMSDTIDTVISHADRYKVLKHGCQVAINDMGELRDSLTMAGGDLNEMQDRLADAITDSDGND